MPHKYANLADIVNGFDFAEAWQFIRKGKDDWSLIGIDRQGNVAFEIEHLYYSQILKTCAKIDADAPIEEVTEPQTKIRRESISRTLEICLEFLKGDLSKKKQAKMAVEALLRELTQPKKEEPDGKTSICRDG